MTEPTLTHDDQVEARDLPREVIHRAIARYHQTQAIHNRNLALLEIDPRLNPWMALEHLVALDAQTHLTRVILATDLNAGQEVTTIEKYPRPTRGIAVENRIYLVTPVPFLEGDPVKPGDANRNYLVVYDQGVIRDLDDDALTVDSMAGRDIPIPEPPAPRPARTIDPATRELVENVTSLAKLVGVAEVNRRIWMAPPRSGI